jgi:hypothetical protein
MTHEQLWDKLMPLVGPLHVAEAVRGRDDVDEALAAKVAEELHRRFHVPLHVPLA